MKRSNPAIITLGILLVTGAGLALLGIAFALSEYGAGLLVSRLGGWFRWPGDWQVWHVGLLAIAILLVGLFLLWRARGRATANERTAPKEKP